MSNNSKYHADYYKKNKDRITAKRKEKELEIKEYRAAYYQKNKEKLCENRRLYAKENREKENKYKRERYVSDPEFKKKRHADAVKRYAKKKEWMSSIKSHYGCMNSNCCWEGELGHVCLDFHHLNKEDKEFNVGTKVLCSKLRIIKEINKCAVLCANCHRVVTHDESHVVFESCSLDDSGNIITEDT